MKNIKKIMALVLALVMLAAFAGCGNADTSSDADAKKLIIATNAEFEPFESLDENNNPIGFDIDLMNAIGKKLGYEIQYDNMEFDGVVAAVNQGACDAAISGLTINEKRKKSVDFTDAYYSGAAQILIVANDDTHFTGTTKEELDEQLKNQKVGVCSGFTGQDYAEGDEEWGFTGIEGADIKIYENISLAIADIKNGNINVIIMDDSTAKEAAAENADSVKIIDVALTVEEYGIAVAKGNEELLSDINNALSELKSEGFIDDLLAQYELNK